jgi:hypothetical protein
MKQLAITPIGLVFRVEDKAGGVLHTADTQLVEAYFTGLGFEIESHEALRIDGSHVVAVVLP